MRKNRIIYSAIFIILFWIMIMYNSWQTELIFKVGIVVPVVIGIINFLTARRIKVYFDEQEEYCQKEDGIKKYIMFDNDTIFPAARIELKVEIVDYFGHKEKRIIVVNSEPRTIRNFRMDMLFHHYGIMTVRIKQIRVYDFFFLSVYKKKLNIETLIYIFPDFGKRMDFFIRNSRCGVNEDENEEFSTGKKGENRGEIIAIDEYHEGDDIRNIHWKLSSKSDELIVKHFGNMVDEKVHIHVDTFVDSESRYESSDKILGVVYSLINTCNSCNIPYDLTGYGEKGACETDASHLLRLICDCKKENLDFSDILQTDVNTGTNIYITTKHVKKELLPDDAIYINIQEQEEENSTENKKQYFLENNTVLHLEVVKQQEQQNNLKPFLEPYNDKIRCHKKIKHINGNFKYMALQSFIALLAAGMAVFSIYDVIFFERDSISIPFLTVSFFIFVHFILNVIGDDMEEKRIGRIRNIVIFGGYLLILIFGGVFFVFDGVSNIIDAFGMDILVSEGDYGFFEYSSPELDWLLILITYAVADVIYNFCMEFVLLVHILIVVPLISISMIVGYVPPSYVVLFGLIYFPAIFAIHSSIGFGKKKKQKYLSDDYPYTGNVAFLSGCITIIVTMAAFCLVMFHIFFGGYQRPAWMTQCKSVINEVLEEGNLKGGIRILSDLFKSEQVLVSGKRGNLDDTVPVSYTGELVLTIEMNGGGTPVQKGIYLKSFAGTDYKGDLWEERSNNEIKQEEEYLKKAFGDFGYREQDDTYLDIYFTEAAAFREKLAQYFAGCQAMGLYYVTAQEDMYTDYSMRIQSHLKEDTNIYKPYFSRTGTKGTVGGDGYEYFSKEDAKNTVKFSGYMLESSLNINNVRDKFGEYPYVVGMLEDEYFGEEIKTMIELEKRYAEYVEQNYTEVPEQLKELKDKFSDVSTIYQGRQLRLVSGDYQYRTLGYEPYAQYIRRYFSENGFTYNINIVRKNENADFIDDFMARKTGYCIHFASAAVMMFRSMGIPARYAEGYFADNECITERTGDAVKYNITDKSAHAWVEIYQEGLGWVPVEVTPGTENFEVNHETTIPENPTQNTTAENNNQPTSTNLNESTVENPQETTTATIKENQKNEENTPKPLSPKAKVLIKGIFFLLVVIGVFLLRYQIVSRRAFKKLETGAKSVRLGEMERQFKEIFHIFKINIEQAETNEEKAELLNSFQPELSIEEALYVFKVLDKFRYGPKGSMETEEVDKLYHFMKKYGQFMYEQGKVYEKFIYKYIKCLYLKNK